MMKIMMMQMEPIRNHSPIFQFQFCKKTRLESYFSFKSCTLCCLVQSISSLTAKHVLAINVCKLLLDKFLKRESPSKYQRVILQLVFFPLKPINNGNSRLSDSKFKMESGLLLLLWIFFSFILIQVQKVCRNAFSGFPLLSENVCFPVCSASRFFPDLHRGHRHKSNLQLKFHLVGFPRAQKLKTYILNQPEYEKHHLVHGSIICVTSVLTDMIKLSTSSLGPLLRRNLSNFVIQDSIL